MNDAGREERRVARGVPGVVRPGQLCTISRSPKSFLEPLLAALDILVQQLREIADDEGEDDRGEELGAPLEFRLYTCTHVNGEGRVCRRDWVRLDRLRVLVQELHVQEQLAQALHIGCRGV